MLRRVNLIVVVNPSRRVSHYLRSRLLIPAYSAPSKSPSTNENATKCLSHSILESNGFISDSNASGPGLISTLPLGSRVLNKLMRVVRDEMNAAGGQEIEMPSLSDLSLWTKTGRDAAMGSELLRVRDRKDKSLCLCPTHEEVVTSLVARHSKTLSPEFLAADSLRLYQITRKFRDESKPRHGLFRAREFIMKDMYTFHASEECVEKTYAEVCRAYETIFKRLELNVKKAVASVGAMGGSKSHEYHILSDVGEDKILVCEKCGQAASMDVFDESKKPTQSGLCQLVKCNQDSSSDTSELPGPKRAIECGHTFVLGERYTKQIPVKIGGITKILMGCYGIGVSRLMQACVEVYFTYLFNLQSLYSLINIFYVFI